MSDLCLRGGQVLGPCGFDIRDIGVSGRLLTDGGAGTSVRQVDLEGYWILPGMIDLHGDGFERHLAPRRGVMKDVSQGLLSCDAELAANGITTAVLAQFYSWEGGMRGADFAERFVSSVQKARSELLTDVQIQLRFETHMLADYARFEALVTRGDVRYVIFNDHVPHAALAKGKRPPRLTGQALKGGRSPEAHLAMLQALHAQSDLVPAACAALAQRLRAREVLLGSHDERTAQQRSDWAAMDVTISEFPETKEAARAAQKADTPIVLGAPNVVRGGSHSGNVAAQDLIAAGMGDGLASDYHYPAMKQAAFALADANIAPFADVWKLVSERPAQVLGMTDRGRIQAGLRADFIVLDPKTRRIEATFCNGRISHMSGGCAARFLA